MTDQIIGFDVNGLGFGTIPKSVMQSQEISIKAKAVYAYFCSFTGAGDSCFPSRNKICTDLEISKDSLTKYIRELREAGLLKIEQEKSDGRFLRNVYTLTDAKNTVSENTVSENSVSENSVSENSVSENSVSENSVSENTVSENTVSENTVSENSVSENSVSEKLATKNNSIKNNSIKNNSNKKKERKTGGYDEILSSISDETLRELYLEYIKMRKLIKSPMTDRALQMLINKVEALETDIERQKKLLEVAIMNNWKSVYPLEKEKCVAPDASSGVSDEGAAEKLRRLNREKRRGTSL